MDSISKIKPTNSPQAGTAGKNDDKPVAPDTGDDRNIGFYLGMMIFALIGIVVTSILSKKTNITITASKLGGLAKRIRVS